MMKKFQTIETEQGNVVLVYGDEATVKQMIGELGFDPTRHNTVANLVGENGRYGFLFKPEIPTSFVFDGEVKAEVEVATNGKYRFLPKIGIDVDNKPILRNPAGMGMLFAAGVAKLAKLAIEGIKDGEQFTFEPLVKTGLELVGYARKDAAYEVVKLSADYLPIPLGFDATIGNFGVSADGQMSRYIGRAFGTGAPGVYNLDGELVATLEGAAMAAAEVTDFGNGRFILSDLEGKNTWLLDGETITEIDLGRTLEEDYAAGPIVRIGKIDGIDADNPVAVTLGDHGWQPIAFVMPTLGGSTRTPTREV